MKKLFIILAVCILSSGVYAHCGSCGIGESSDQKREKSYSDKPHSHTEKDSKLSLSDKQKKELDKISDDYYKKLHKLRRSYKRKIAKVLKNEEERKIFFEETN